MSTATAVDAGAPKKGKKKLIILVAVAALVLSSVGGAVVMMKKKAADAEAEADDGDGQTTARSARHGSHAVPAFVALDPFTVNLADREAERYAQIGITLELEDENDVDQVKAYMPAIRNNVLLAIADRTAAELQGRDGKRLLAEKIRRETSRALGVEIDDDEVAADDEATDHKPTRKKKRKKTALLPVRAVHFSNFIVQ
jgi:flagellar protein FliL